MKPLLYPLALFCLFVLLWFKWIVLLVVICGYCLLTFFSLFKAASMGDEAMTQAFGGQGQFSMSGSDDPPLKPEAPATATAHAFDSPREKLRVRRAILRNLVKRIH